MNHPVFDKYKCHNTEKNYYLKSEEGNGRVCSCRRVLRTPILSRPALLPINSVINPMLYDDILKDRLLEPRFSMPLRWCPTQQYIRLSLNRAVLHTLRKQSISNQNVVKENAMTDSIVLVIIHSMIMTTAMGTDEPNRKVGRTVNKY